jgi:predicted TIM-barrel fold metal-dependent hydrolase
MNIDNMMFNLIKSPAEATADALIMLAPQLSALTANDLIVAGVFKKCPDLRIALSEGGIGWIPFYLDRLDRHVENQSWTGLSIDGSRRRPTEIFRDHFLACFVTDPSALRLLDRIGEDIVAWECDYPHSDSTWPRSPEMLMDECQAAGLTDAQIHKISWENACRFFRYDPFAHIPRERATVGALRATATDVDTSETSKAEYRRRFEAAMA